MGETQVQFRGWENFLEKEMATHSSIIAWEFPWTEGPGGLQSTESQRIKHDLVTKQQQIIYLPSISENESCSVTFDSATPWTVNSPGQNTEVRGHSLLQGIFPTQGSNPVLPHCRRNFYQLSHQV